MSAGRRHWLLRRYWPAAAILVAATALFVGIELFHDASRQGRFLAQVPVVGIAAILLWLWCLLLSPFSWRRRLLACGTTLAACGAVAAAVRITGVTGDLYPILSWRWSVPVEPPPPGAQVVQPNIDLSRIDELDYPWFLGTQRDGMVRGVRLERDWRAHPPREVWRRAVGAAWSSFAVAAGHAVTLEQRGDEEAIICYELATGREAWASGYPARYEEVIGGLGPRATPAIAAGCVFAAGATGILSCLDGATGSVLWR
jgi:outer membrane protein assembly factor BamB